MELVCPRCQSANRAAAKFCARCGLSLETGVDGTRRAGRLRDARPLPAPPGLVPVEGAANLYFRWESAFGGEPVLGTEGVQVLLFNAGYSLRNVLLDVRGDGRDGAEVFAVEQPVAELPRGGRAAFEVGSYLIPAALRVVRVALVSAEFAEDAMNPPRRGTG
jgi:hypothetical protein